MTIFLGFSLSCVKRVIIFLFSTDLCYGGRSNSINRRRRAVDFADDDIDDFDEILPFDPLPFNYTVLAWPTPSGLTKDNVTDICNRRIKYSNAGGRCESVKGVNMDALIDQCVSDIQVAKLNCKKFQKYKCSRELHCD